MDGSDYLEEDRARALLTMALASYALSVPLGRVAAGRRDMRTSLARHAAMYVAHVAFGMSMARVGDAFGRDRSTVGHACRLIEDWRDDTRFDLWMDALERSAMAAPRPAAVAVAANALLGVTRKSTARELPDLTNARDGRAS